MPRVFLVALALLVGAYAHASSQVIRLPRPQPESQRLTSPAPAATAGLVQQSHARQLAKKLDELNNLQQEVDRLRQVTGTPSQVVVKLRLVEISLTRLAMLREDESAHEHFDPALVDSILSAKDHPLRTVVMDPGFDALLDSLLKERTASTVAEQSLTVSSGSPASFQQGLEVPVVKREGDREWVEYQKVGVEAHVNLVALGGNRVRVELRLGQDQRVAPAVTLSNLAATGKRRLEVNVGFEAALGQTVAFHNVHYARRISEKRVIPWLGEIPYIGNAFSRTVETKDEALTLLLVTPEAVSAVGNIAQAAAAAVAPDSRQQVNGQQNNQDLLASKLAELNALRPEVERLRHLCRQGQQVVVSLKMIELSRSRLKEYQNEHGEPDAALIERLVSEQPAGASVDSERLGSLLERLRSAGFVSILSEPDLAAYVGRPANFNSGGEYPVVVAEGIGGVAMKNKKRGTVDVLHKTFGTEIGFMPISVTDQRARLQLHYRCSKIDDADRVELHGINMSGLRVRDVQTEVDAPLGQTTIVHVATSTGVIHSQLRKGTKEAGTDRIEDLITLVLVKPILLTARIDRPSPVPGSATPASATTAQPPAAPPREAKVYTPPGEGSPK